MTAVFAPRSVSRFVVPSFGVVFQIFQAAPTKGLLVPPRDSGNVVVQLNDLVAEISKVTYVQ